MDLVKYAEYKVVRFDTARVRDSGKQFHDKLVTTVEQRLDRIEDKIQLARVVPVYINKLLTCVHKLADNP